MFLLLAAATDSSPQGYNNNATTTPFPSTVNPTSSPAPRAAYGLDDVEVTLLLQTKVLQAPSHGMKVSHPAGLCFQQALPYFQGVARRLHGSLAIHWLTRWFGPFVLTSRMASGEGKPELPLGVRLLLPSVCGNTLADPLHILTCTLRFCLGLLQGSNCDGDISVPRPVLILKTWLTARDTLRTHQTRSPSHAKQVRRFAAVKCKH